MKYIIQYKYILTISPMSYTEYRGERSAIVFKTRRTVYFAANSLLPYLDKSF